MLPLEAFQDIVDNEQEESLAISTLTGIGQLRLSKSTERSNEGAKIIKEPITDQLNKQEELAETREMKLRYDEDEHEQKNQDGQVGSKTFNQLQVKAIGSLKSFQADLCSRGLVC